MAGNVELRVEGLNELIARIEDASTVGGPLRWGATEMGKALVGRIKAEAPRGATSELHDGIVFSVQLGGKGLPESIAIESEALYAEAVIQGQNPHWPPYGPNTRLRRWVAVRLRPPNVGLAALRVARKIARVGTEPNPFDERGVRNAQGDLDSIASEVEKRIVRNLDG